jgi:diketogulonate reductase-like aldo/keto reductase
MNSIDLAGRSVPRIGQGTWRMGEDPARARQEIAALQQGIDLGVTLLDTAEMYGEGGAEKIVGQAIQGRRDDVMLVSKVYPHNASSQGVIKACERSLQRLNTERIDLYLLHWRGQYPLSETVEAFERLQAQGKIGRWGVSNFDVDDMTELDDAGCATNQVLYNLEERGIEFDLLPWCAKQAMPLMAYCPIAQGGRLLDQPALRQVAERHGITPAQACLAWVVRHENVIAIPKASTPEHVRLNAGALQVKLDEADLASLDAAYPPPLRKQRLNMV